jgi:hypothetical protein
MFLQFMGGSGKWVVRPKIHHSPLQPVRIAAALDLCGLLERPHDRPGSTLPKGLLLYLDFSEDREPVERFFSFRLNFPL